MNLKKIFLFLYAFCFGAGLNAIEYPTKGEFSGNFSEVVCRDGQSDIKKNCDDDDCCTSKLKFERLCAKKLRAFKALFRDLCAERIKSKWICTDKLGVNEEAAINSICANTIQSKDMCVTNSLRINSVCLPYDAEVVYSADTLYTLGTDLSFDFIVRDPDNDITLAPTIYNAPIEGTYVLQVQVDQRDLDGSNIIVGTPVALIEVVINNVVTRRTYYPFLSFHNEQFSTLTTVVYLKAGDQVKSRYKVLVVTDTGFQEYIGTVVILGGLTNSQFHMHYLSSACSPIACEPCITTTCDTECKPFCNYDGVE